MLEDGITFDSKKEMYRYRELKLLLKAGEIVDLKLQVPFTLQEAFTDYTGKKQRPITYLADFVYVDKEKKQQVVEDVKGMRTEKYLLKKKLFLYKYPLFFFIEV